MENVVSVAVAEQEINKWLDARKVRQSVRAKNQPNIEVLVDAVCDGLLVLQEDNSLKQTLVFPIGTKDNTIALATMEHKNRFKVHQLSTQMDDVNSKNYVDITMSYVAAITDQPKSLIKNLENDDFKIAQAVAAFFM